MRERGVQSTSSIGGPSSGVCGSVEVSCAEGLAGPGDCAEAACCRLRSSASAASLRSAASAAARAAERAWSAPLPLVLDVEPVVVGSGSLGSGASSGSRSSRRSESPRSSASEFWTVDVRRSGLLGLWLSESLAGQIQLPGRVDPPSTSGICEVEGRVERGGRGAAPAPTEVDGPEEPDPLVETDGLVPVGPVDPGDVCGCC